MNIYPYNFIVVLLYVIFLSAMSKCEEIFRKNFGFEERHRTIEKCNQKLNLIFKEKFHDSISFDYDYVMNHCIVIDRKFLKGNLKILYDYSKLKKSYEFFNIVHNPKLIEKSKFSKKLNEGKIPKENISTLYDCLNVAKLSRKYFFYKTLALKEHREDEEKL